MKGKTKNSIASYKEMKIELDRIKEKGYSIDLEENEIGLICYSVPVFSKNEEVIAVISISGPTGRLEMRKVEMIKSLKEISKNISQEL